ncbi:MAG: alpha/beta fold hydrolase [Ramlibacter sp.]|nr:alpha/beta fold hydrolase [Ramlibacter sp.]
MTVAPAVLYPDIRRVLAGAIRLTTPCGAGELVWHSWGEGEPLVLLHGGSGSWTHWIRNVEPLAASGRRVLVPDLPGFGDSAQPPEGSDADALPEPLEAGLAQLIGRAACDIAGFSFGGMTAGLMLARYPARARRLVVIGAPGLGLASRRMVALTPWRHIEDEAERDAIHRSNLAALMLFRPEAIDQLALEVHKANVVRDRMKGRSLAFTDALVRALASVRCPVWAIYGAEDALYQGRMAEVEPALRAAPDFRGPTLLPEAGHWVQFEQPGAFDTALLAALNTR